MTAETVSACPRCGGPHRGVDVYPVGWLAVLRRARRAVFGPRFREVRRHALAGLKYQARSTVRHIRNRQWRDLKNEFNGYLAEPHHWPDGLHRCGCGWTKARAMRSLRRRGYRGPS